MCIRKSGGSLQAASCGECEPGSHAPDCIVCALLKKGDVAKWQTPKT